MPGRSNSQAPSRGQSNTQASSQMNTRRQTISTGSSRRRTSRLAKAQEAAAEARRAAFLRLSQRRGLGGLANSFPQESSEESDASEDPSDKGDGQGHYDDTANPFDPAPGSSNIFNPQRNDSGLEEHAEYYCLRRYADRREEISRQWNELNNQVVAAYLLCQQTTLNWTTPPNNYTLPPGVCTCPSNDISIRKVDLLDMLRKPIPFCKCTPDVVRLIHYGYFACSAEAPRTAFSIRLVQYHHHLWQATAVSASGFIESLSSFLDTRTDSPLLNRGSTHKRRQLRVPFSHCSDLYSRILTSQKKLFEDGLQLTKSDKWANKCPQCFGPQHHEVKSDPTEPDFMIALDGNFQQRHYADASKDNPREEQYPESFILPSKIANDMEALSASEHVAVGINVCYYVTL
ncbi:hypothetical protein PtA15_18A172 [Puccinia triticina]|uniref:CxC1-like cysteine cluster associated with KDZ transposases domain-containing protein n=1 Tax=Puccinia triticina TaxID=208348 RepID=A0ABY7D8L1_9BASI|nr:uncharacterized protein PtA15_18A172 [Puccinia triticina]WAQ93114.1 hypothetical protein PtA15_18A172 [Puccinia triticina]